MCLTVRNAAAVLDHEDRRSPALGFTRTRHHVGHLGPGDWWFPAPDQLPHIVTGVHRRHDRIVVTDQYGSNYSHPCDAVVPTAVPDTRVITSPTPGADAVTKSATGTGGPRG